MTLFSRPQPSALLHPDMGVYVVPQPGVGYEDSDPLVKAHRWAFVTGSELEALLAPDQGFVESVPRPVEDAERSPGRKRTTKRG